MSHLIGYIVFNRVRVQSANAISSPLTYGFPAITAFLGGVHALSRKLSESVEFKELSLGGVMICAHECEPQIYRTSNYSDFTFNLSRNPILKTGKTAAISEEGKVHLQVTLVTEVYGEDIDELAEADIDPEQLCEQLHIWVRQQRLAGGSVLGLSRYQPVEFYVSYDIKQIIKTLLPGSVLMSAATELTEITEELQQIDPEASELDALIEVCTLHHDPDTSKKVTQWGTRSARSGRGWLAPIPVGFQGISERYEPGVMQHTRNPEYPAQFVECLYSLGKWVFAGRIDDLTTAFWRYEHHEAESLYLTTQNPTVK